MTDVLIRGVPEEVVAAIEVQARLADRDQHRAPSVPDLLIAATAELAGVGSLGVCR